MSGFLLQRVDFGYHASVGRGDFGGIYIYIVRRKPGVFEDQPGYNIILFECEEYSSGPTVF
jgi:hypothetical protein